MTVRGPTQKEYEKFSPNQRIVYWACVASVSAIVESLLKKLSSVENEKSDRTRD